MRAPNAYAAYFACIWAPWPLSPYPKSNSLTVATIVATRLGFLRRYATVDVAPFCVVLYGAVIGAEDFIFLPSVALLLGAACRCCCRGYGLVHVACGAIAVRAASLCCTGRCRRRRPGRRRRRWRPKEGKSDRPLRCERRMRLLPSGAWSSAVSAVSLVP